MTASASEKLKPLQRIGALNKAIRILYVEDTPVMRDTLGQLLEIYGYEVAFAKNGQEGVKMANQWRPDLVLMDLRMPVMDGYKAIHQLKLNPQTHHTPIFVITAWSGKKERDQARLAGADAFYVKPPDLNRLIEAINIAVAASTQKPKL